MANDSVGRVFLVAFLVCVVCSLLVSGTAAGLRAKKERDALAMHYRNVLGVTGLLTAEADPVRLWSERVEVRLVELENGAYSDAFDAQTFDPRRAASEPRLSRRIPAELDLAGLRSRSRYMPVYHVRQADGSRLLVLPVHGRGLWSTLFGYLALADDLRTVRGFGFYEHGETPGLGGEVDNPSWLAQFPGKQAFDEDGRPRLEVLRGRVDPANPQAIYQLDGLSGATVTARGVGNLLQYWLGADGFGPYLERLRKEAGHG